MIDLKKKEDKPITINSFVEINEKIMIIRTALLKQKGKHNDTTTTTK